jgi:hypothetical protein
MEEAKRKRGGGRREEACLKKKGEGEKGQQHEGVREANAAMDT